MVGRQHGVHLRGDEREARVALADAVHALRRRDEREEDDALLRHPALHQLLDGSQRAVAAGQDGVQQQHVARGDVQGKLLVDDLAGPGVALALDQNLADLDALAACAQRVLHGLTGADDGDAAELVAELDAAVLVARGRRHAALRERQVAQPVLHHEADEAVGVENKVVARSHLVPDDGVHPPDLKVAGQQLQIAEDAAQILLAQLDADVLHDEVDGHAVLAARPGNDDVSVLLARRHVCVEHGLDELGVLLDHAVHVAPAVAGVALDAARQAHVVVRVHEDLHVRQLANLIHRQRQNALEDDHVARLNLLRLNRPAVRLEVVDGHIHRAPRLQVHQALHNSLLVHRVGVVKVVLLHVRQLIRRQPPIKRILQPRESRQRPARPR